MADKKAMIRRYEGVVGKLTGSAVKRDVPAVFRADGYVNMFNKYGTSKDTSEHYFFEREYDVPDELLEQYYEGNGLFSRIIDAPAEEALRNGFELKNITDDKLTMFMDRSLDELDWTENAITAIKWARLFGGSIIVMLVNDGRGIDEPLDWNNIESIDDIRLYDRSMVVPDYSSMFVYEYTDPFHTRGSRLGMPEYYTVNSRYGSFVVHESRCLIFQNGVLPENATNSLYQIWGMPEYVRIHRAVRDVEIAAGSATKMLDRAVQAVYSMKDLAVELSTEEGEDRILRRLEAIDMARGMMNTVTIDSEGEDYSFRQFSFNGVSEVIDSTCNYLSALTNIPQTILFGRSPAGMNSTGEADFENYYNYVQRIQKRMLRSNLRYLLGIIFQAGVKSGEIEKVPKIDIEFNPLWSMSDMEKEQYEQAKIQTEMARANAINMYVQMGAVSVAEVRKKLAEKETFDVETILDGMSEKELFPNGMPKYGEDKQQQGQQGQPGGGAQPGQEGQPGAGADPMAALLGGAPEESKEAPKEEVKEEVKVEEKDKDVGNAMPDAPEATRLPQDKSKKAKKEVGEEDVKFFQKDGVQRGTGVLVVKDGKILTGIRKSDNGYGLICGPGGKIEDNETAKEGAIRELHEEFGIYPRDMIFIGRGEKEEGSPFEPSYIFLCTDFEGKPKADGTEMVRERWRSVKEIKSLRCFKPFENGVDVLCEVLSTPSDPQPPERKKTYNFDKDQLNKISQCDTINMDEWEEGKHPRDENGQFASVGNSGSSEGQTSTKITKVTVKPKGVNKSCIGFKRDTKGNDRGGQHFAEHVLTNEEPIYSGMSKKQYFDHVEEMLRKPVDDRIWGFNGIEIDADTGEEVEYIVRYDSKTHEFCKGYPGRRIVTGFMAKYINERTRMPDPDYKKKALDYYKKNEELARESLKGRRL